MRFGESLHQRVECRQHMNMVVAVDMGRLLAEDRDKALILTRQLTGYLGQIQLSRLALVPDPLVELALFVHQRGERRERLPPAEHKVQPDWQFGEALGQPGGMLDGGGGDNRSGGADDPVLERLYDAVVLGATEAEIVGVDDQSLAHEGSLAVKRPACGQAGRAGLRRGRRWRRRSWAGVRGGPAAARGRRCGHRCRSGSAG